MFGAVFASVILALIAGAIVSAVTGSVVFALIAGAGVFCVAGWMFLVENT